MYMEVDIAQSIFLTSELSWTNVLITYINISSIDQLGDSKHTNKYKKKIELPSNIDFV